MKILHISDIHNDLEAAKLAVDFANEKCADAIAISGDIAGPYFKKEDCQKVSTTNKILSSLRAQLEFNSSLYDLSTFVLDEKNENSKKIRESIAGFDLKKVAEDYRTLFNSASELSKKTYNALEDILKEFKLPEGECLHDSRVLMVPGNWDTSTMLDELSRYTLHGRDSLHELDDVSFVGFGASSELMGHFIPQDLEINFSSIMAYNYLSQFSGEKTADVCITHCPPYNVADFITVKKEDGETIKHHLGDLGVLAYLLEYQPTVMLCGHAHNPHIHRKGKTVVINSGNLGRYHGFIDTEQEGPAGSFALAYLDKNTFFDKAEFYHITDIKKGIDSITKLGGMFLNKNTDKLEQIQDSPKIAIATAPDLKALGNLR